MERKFGCGAHWGRGKFAEFSLPAVIPPVIVRNTVTHLFIHPFLSAHGAAQLMEFYRILQSCHQVQSLVCTLSLLYIKSVSLNLPTFVIYTETGTWCEICRHSKKYVYDRFYCLLIERKYEPTSPFFPVQTQKYRPTACLLSIIHRSHSIKSTFFSLLSWFVCLWQSCRLLVTQGCRHTHANTRIQTRAHATACALSHWT